MNDFWIPQFKYQIVEWLEKHYPNGSTGKKIIWNKFEHKILRAIYISYRKRLEVQRETEKKNTTETQQELNRRYQLSENGVFDTQPGVVGIPKRDAE